MRFLVVLPLLLPIALAEHFFRWSCPWSWPDKLDRWAWRIRR